MNNCKRMPEEVREQFREGANEVIVCKPKWNINGKFIEREGEDNCARYKKEDFPEDCL